MNWLSEDNLTYYNGKVKAYTEDLIENSLYYPNILINGWLNGDNYGWTIDDLSMSQSLNIPAGTYTVSYLDTDNKAHSVTINVTELVAIYVVGLYNVAISTNYISFTKADYKYLKLEKGSNSTIKADVDASETIDYIRLPDSKISFSELAVNPTDTSNINLWLEIEEV